MSIDPVCSTRCDNWTQWEQLKFGYILCVINWISRQPIYRFTCNIKGFEFLSGFYCCLCVDFPCLLILVALAAMKTYTWENICSSWIQYCPKKYFSCCWEFIIYRYSSRISFYITQISNWIHFITLLQLFSAGQSVTI